MSKPISITITGENEDLLKIIAESFNEFNKLKKEAEATGSAGGAAGKKGAQGMNEFADSADKANQEMQEVTNTAKKAGSEMSGVGKSAQKAGNEASSAAEKTKKKNQETGDSAKKAGDDIARAGKKGADGLNVAQKSADGLSAKLADVTVIAGGIAFAFSKIKDAAVAIIGPGVQFYKQMEFSELGIAGILISMTKLKGETLTLNQALAISGKTINDVQQTAARIGLPMKDMVDSFQAIIGPGLEAKGTLEEIVQFTATGTKAVKSFGLDSMQTVQELRSMVSGDINQDSQVSKALGITSADISKAKQSADGLFKYLNDKLSGFRAIAEKIPDTLTGKSERFASMFEQASAEGFKPIIDELKQGLDLINSKLFVVNDTTKKIQFNPELLDTVHKVTDTTGVLIEELSQVGRTLEPVAIPMLKLTGSLLLFIIEHVQAVAVGLGTWIIIQKFNTVLKSTEVSTSLLGRAIQNVKKAWDDSAVSVVKLNDTWNGSARKIEINNGRVVRSIKTMTTALQMTKTAIRGLASATLWGAISVAAGIAVEEVIDHIEKAKQKKQPKSVTNDVDIGHLSSEHEGKLHSISSGEDDPYGGKSYGPWQISSKQGTLATFVQWLNDNGYEVGPLLARGENKSAGIPAHDVELASPEFDSLYLDAVKDYGDSFYRAQKEFIKETHYDPANAMLSRDFGFDANSRSNAMQQVLWSTAVQHGPGASGVYDAGAWAVFAKAANLAGVPNVSYLNDEQLIPYIYQARKILNPRDTDRYITEGDEAMQLLAKHPQVNGSDLETKDPPQDVKELAQAKIALAEAIANGTLQQYIQDLQNKEDGLKQRLDKTKAGVAEDPISEEDYFTQIKSTTTAKTLAEITFLEQQKANQQSLMSNKNLTMADQERIKAEIVKIDSDINAKRKQLENTLQQLNFSQQQALQELIDQGLDALITRLEQEGKLGEAAQLKLEKQNRGLLQMFSVNKMPEAKTNLEKNAEYEVTLAKYHELSNEYDAYKEKLHNDITALGSQLSSGAISPEKYRAELNKLLTEFDSYTVATKGKMEVLAQSLNDPKITQAIRKMIPESLETHFNALNDQVALIQKVEEQKLKALDAERARGGMSDLEYEQRKYQIQRETAEQINTEIIPAMKELRGLLSPEQRNIFDSLVGDLDNLSNQLPPLQERFRNFAQQGLEEFFTTGIQQCEDFADAVRDMIGSILMEIQKLYAQEMAAKLKNQLGDFFYNMFGSKTPTTKTDTGTSTDTPKPEKKSKGGSLIEKFALGGSMDSGKVSGPGTKTSDSILAYVGNLGKFIQIADGEYVMKGSAVNQWGTDILDAMNEGRVPDAFKRARFASGGHVAGSAVDGPQELAASLTSNNSTTIPLNIFNVHDAEIVGKYFRSRSGGKAVINHIKDNANIIRQVLKI